MKQWSNYCSLGGFAPFELIHPHFFDATAETQSGGGHYFYQDIWALRCVRQWCPQIHHDIGSRLDGFVGQVTSICPVEYWDIRPPSFSLPDFHFRKGSILSLPVESGSLISVSCLHTVEHIGLGRYGDTLDQHGTRNAIAELGRVVAENGQLLLSMPVGRPRVCFNAQRILHPYEPLEILSHLKLAEFSVVDDQDRFHVNVDPESVADCGYACGLYRFQGFR